MEVGNFKPIVSGSATSVDHGMVPLLSWNLEVFIGIHPNSFFFFCHSYDNWKIYVTFQDDNSTLIRGTKQRVGLAGWQCVPFLQKLQFSSKGLFCVYKFPVEPFVIWISMKEKKNWNFLDWNFYHSKLDIAPTSPTASMTEEIAIHQPTCSFEIAGLFLPKSPQSPGKPLKL